MSRRTMTESCNMTRRSFLQSSVAGVALAGSLGRVTFATDDKNPYGGFKMGIQSFSLRIYGAEEALTHTNELGLAYWESFSKHFPMTNDSRMIVRYKKKLSDHGIKLMTYGVQDF